MLCIVRSLFGTWRETGCTRTSLYYSQCPRYSWPHPEIGGNVSQVTLRVPVRPIADLSVMDRTDITKETAMAPKYVSLISIPGCLVLMSCPSYNCKTCCFCRLLLPSSYMTRIFRLYPLRVISHIYHICHLHHWIVRLLSRSYKNPQLVVSRLWVPPSRV